MFVKDWLLPILIGIVAAIALISILYNNPKVKQAFADIGAMMQLNASKPQVMNVMPVLMESFENSDALMQLETSSVNTQPQYNLNSTSQTDSFTDSFTEPLITMGEVTEFTEFTNMGEFTDMNALTELQKKELELSNVKIWNPLPSQYSCTSENVNNSNPLNILHSPNCRDIYNDYPQINNKL